MSKLVPIVCEGKRFESVAAMCNHYGVERFKTHSRIQRGWTPEQAVGLVPHEESIFRPKPVELNGQRFENLTAAAAAIGVELATVKKRISSGYSLEDAFLGRLKPRVGSRGKPVEFGGTTYPSIETLAREFKLTGTLVAKRLKSGWTVAQALETVPAPPRFRNFEGHARDQKWKEVRTTDGAIEPVPDTGGYKLYLVANTVNEKVYVGITVGELNARLRQHFAAARRGRKSAFMNAINKYGESAFRIELLSDDARTYDELQDQEVQEIVRRDSISNGYNTAQGGSIGTAKHITIAGRTFPSHVSAAAHYSIVPEVFILRLTRLKWTPEEAAGLVKRSGMGIDIPVTVEGVTYPNISQVAAAYGLSPASVHDKYRSRGWTIEQSLGIAPPPDSAKYAGMTVTLNGRQFGSIAEAAKAVGINPESFRKRLRGGMQPDEAYAKARKKPD